MSTVTEIAAKQARAAIKFEAAKKIREILDDAREQYGANDWDGDDLEAEVYELVIEDAS